MKKIICTVLALVCVITLMGCVKTAETEPSCTTYTKTSCKVYDVFRYGDEVAIIDEDGNVWTFVDSAFNKSIGDECVLVMHNNGTPHYIYDDIILEIQ